METLRKCDTEFLYKVIRLSFDKNKSHAALQVYQFHDTYAVVNIPLHLAFPSSFQLLTYAPFL